MDKEELTLDEQIKKCEEMLDDFSDEYVLGFRNGIQEMISTMQLDESLPVRSYISAFQMAIKLLDESKK